MYLIVGLGNPGIAYLNTRHNVGFCAVDHLADKLNIAVNRYKHKALVGEGFVSGKKVMLAKPQTYMNLSGESVQELMAYYKVELAHLVVLYADIDLEIGDLRILSLIHIYAVLRAAQVRQTRRRWLRSPRRKSKKLQS